MLVLKNQAVAAILVLVATSEICHGLSFFLEPRTKRCLKQEMYPDQLAVGEYEISSLPGTTVDVKMTDRQGHIAFTRENIDGKGKFAVTTDIADIYDLCFTYTSNEPYNVRLTAREVTVDLKIGAEAKFDQTLDSGTVNQVERELDRIESISNAIIDDYAHLMQRGREMSDTNESTNRRLFYQAVISIIILSVLTIWQILYLRTFFRSRKLID